MTCSATFVDAGQALVTTWVDSCNSRHGNYFYPHCYNYCCTALTLYILVARMSCRPLFAQTFVDFCLLVICALGAGMSAWINEGKGGI